MAVDEDADQPTSLIYHSVANTAIVAAAQIILWSAFFLSLTSYFDTSADRYVSPVLIGIASGAVGVYMNPKRLDIREWIAVLVVYVVASGFGVAVGWRATAGWQEVVTVAFVAALAFTVAPSTPALARCVPGSCAMHDEILDRPRTPTVQ
jgi:hypothetical protein